MANEQVRIDLTANDQASRVIDDVAEDVERLERADPEIEITADDKATAEIADVADAAEALTRAGAEVEITADDNATDDIRDVADTADALTRADHELILTAKIADAKAELATLRADLDRTGDAADDTKRQMDRIGDSNGPGLAGNSVADLTGPLGDASGKASEIAGVFDGLGDITANMAARVGGDAEKMAGAITGIGFAVTAAAAAWSYFRQRQEAARQRQRELVEGQRELNEAIADGDRTAAAAKFEEMYGDALDAAERFGIGVGAATGFITGQADALPELDDALARVNERLADHQHNTLEANNELLTAKARLEGARDALNGARDGYRDANGTIDEQDRRLRSVSGALRIAETDTDNLARAQRDAKADADALNDQFDRMRGAVDLEQAMIDFTRDMQAALDATGQSALDQRADIATLKQDVIQMGEDLAANPVQVALALEAIERGDLDEVTRQVDEWYRNHPVPVTTHLVGPVFGVDPIPGYPGPQSLPLPDTPAIGVVNMTLPAGWRGDPLRAAHAARRRTGRYYSRMG